MDSPVEVFPFGRAVEPGRAATDGARPVFVLGAYPSALHARWTPPSGGGRAINALAVDNEPTPFWDGSDEDSRLEDWKTAVGWEEDLGTATGVGHLNGSSGLWLDENLLQPLGVRRDDAWITDCLDTYRMSRLMQAAIESVYAPFARSQDLPAANLRVHPDEDAIVAEGVEQHLSRLRRELTTARPERVVTLGNAALRVLRHLLQLPTGTERLSSDRELYGREVQVTLDGRAVAWFPLAHPGSPDTYQSAHREWVMTRR